MDNDNLKEVVRQKYGKAATDAAAGSGSCCGRGSVYESCDPITSNLYDSAQTAGLPETALNASLGCGNPAAIAVMQEIGIDIREHRSKNVDEFNGQAFDYVITVCDNARESCPVFFGDAQKLHHNFQDPAALVG